MADEMDFNFEDAYAEINATQEAMSAPDSAPSFEPSASDFDFGKAYEEINTGQLAQPYEYDSNPEAFRDRVRAMPSDQAYSYTRDPGLREILGLGPLVSSTSRMAGEGLSVSLLVRPGDETKYGYYYGEEFNLSVPLPDYLNNPLYPREDLPVFGGRPGQTVYQYLAEQRQPDSMSEFLSERRGTSLVDTPTGRDIASGERSPAFADVLGKEGAVLDAGGRSTDSTIKDNLRQLTEDKYRAFLQSATPADAAKALSAMDPAVQRATTERFSSELTELAKTEALYKMAPDARRASLMRQFPFITEQQLRDAGETSTATGLEKKADSFLSQYGLDKQASAASVGLALKQAGPEVQTNFISEGQELASKSEAMKERLDPYLKQARVAYNSKMDVTTAGGLAKFAFEASIASAPAEVQDWLAANPAKRDLAEKALVTQLTTSGTLARDTDRANLLASTAASRFVDQLSSQASRTIDGPFESVNALTKKHESYNIGNMMMLLSAGLGVYSALVAQPNAQKANFDFQERMAKRAEKYNIDMFNRQANLSQSLAETAQPRTRSPSKPREVRL